MPEAKTILEHPEARPNYIEPTTGEIRELDRSLRRMKELIELGRHHNDGVDRESLLEDMWLFDQVLQHAAWRAALSGRDRPEQFAGERHADQTDPSGMIFTVPPIQFPVVIVRDKPLDDTGRPAIAHVRTHEPQIVIWAGLDGQNRENALRHELWHAWEWQYLTEGMTVEQRCQIYANASQHFDEEYARQGGRAALAAMVPADEPTDTAA